MILKRKLRRPLELRYLVLGLAGAKIALSDSETRLRIITDKDSRPVMRLVMSFRSHFNSHFIGFLDCIFRCLL